jgi:hypothetical protein
VGVLLESLLIDVLLVVSRIACCACSLFEHARVLLCCLRGVRAAVRAAVLALTVG